MGNNLPTLQQIVDSEKLTSNEKDNALSALLNTPPPQVWIKSHNGVKYLPVDKVRFLLTKIFGLWYHEINAVKLVANSVCVTVTLHYRNPINNTWQKTDGIGAAPINTRKGASAVDWDNIMHDSVNKCVGSADAFALKNAAKNLGRLFGAELTKIDTIDYSALIDKDKFKNASLIEK